MKICWMSLLFFFVTFETWGQTYEGVGNWRYVPVDSSFWGRVQEKQVKKDFSGILEIGEQRLRQAKKDLEKAEAVYAIAIGCEGLELSFCAYHHAIQLGTRNPGSMPATGAFFILENLIQQEAIIEDEVQQLINIGNFKEVPETLLPMFFFYVFKDNLARKLVEWQGEPLRRIDEESYWGSRLKFFKILQLVKFGKIKKAISELEELEKSAVSFPKFYETIRLQKARLLFADRDFREAEKIYSSFLSESRIFGKILLERSWLKYHQKDYSIALGMVESLKSSFFRGSSHPEQYILSMVTYRDLCLYEAVEETYKEFETVYQPWIDHLRDQRPLIENRALLAMVLTKASHFRIGNMIGRIRSEKEHLKNMNLRASLKDRFREIYSIGETRWKDFANQSLYPDLKIAANEFLDYVEQAKLLQYVSGLDKFRLRGKFESRKYKAPDSESFAIQRLFWPVSGEYWWSELNSYRVLVSDQCSEGASK